MLTSPGIFAPGGLLGAGLQSATWIYILRHAGFALFVIAYALLKDSDPVKWPSQGSTRTAIVASVGLVVALACGTTVLVTASNAFMPRVMLDMTQFSDLWVYVAAPTTALFVLALVLL
ncbi:MULTISPECIES: MASE4 domain-containing protein [Paraburkholderia]|uniref:Membrane-associated sensor domain-containing protein n=1 Tax=Paraburkholderia podalyriae TaxID=1938811 RepID=A0ABR7Q302_9BURK|nr:MASE4 domain-containing protein [Paraburkholderia podalyriae]MBC8752883.1 hypothetical protein [Paraburkholderia podalyriae]